LPILADRAVLSVSGPEAAGFLAGLVTCAVPPSPAAPAAFGALLTPQGKILVDFLLVAVDDGFLVDVAAAERDALVKRLTLYRLRAKVAIAAGADRVAAVADAAPFAAVARAAFADPRLDGLGGRLILPPDAAAPDDGFDAAAVRIAAGVPEGGSDFVFGELFPADVNMDVLGGIDFAKGCFVGQEVVARMKHRGTPRWRTLLVASADGRALPPPGTPVEAGGKPVGRLGGARGGQGLAVLRIDRVAEARRAGVAVTAAGGAVVASLPSYAPFGWPDAAAAD
jgi:folate-binding protein YgfZ